MEDNKRYDLLYTPELKPERDYRSEAKFTPKTHRNITPPPEIPTLDDHIEELKELEELIDGLPDIMPLKDLTTKLRERAEIIKEEEELEEYIPDEYWGPEPGSVLIPEEEIDDDINIGTNMPNDIELPKAIPSLFPSPTGVKVQVETPKTLVQIAQESYKRDQIDLQKDYLKKIKFLLQKYFTSQLALAYGLNTSDIDALTKDYDGEAVTGIPANYQHLSDTIIRSQNTKNQKKRFFDKIVNTSQTLQHMRAWNAAEKARERYYEEAYGTSDNFVDSESNALLREARAGYDANYRGALYNMYRYLNSGAQMTEDILDHIAIESKAKAKLLKEGIDIYKTSSTTSNSGTGTTAVQAYTTEQLKSLEQARAANANKTVDLSKATPEEIDQAYEIKTPASESEWGLSPTGGHWDMEDINSLISNDPNTYTARTSEGKEAIKIALSMTPKYTKYEETSSSNSTNSVNNETSSSNSKNEQVEQKSKSNVKEFFEQNKDWLIIH